MIIGCSIVHCSCMDDLHGVASCGFSGLYAVERVMVTWKHGNIGHLCGIIGEVVVIVLLCTGDSSNFSPYFYITVACSLIKHPLDRSALSHDIADTVLKRRRMPGLVILLDGRSTIFQSVLNVTV